MEGFSCGDSAVDGWLGQSALEDAARSGVAVFVAVADSGVVLCY
jgi:hypothetical protein